MILWLLCAVKGQNWSRLVSNIKLRAQVPWIWCYGRLCADCIYLVHLHILLAFIYLRSNPLAAAQKNVRLFFCDPTVTYYFLTGNI